LNWNLFSEEEQAVLPEAGMAAPRPGIVEVDKHWLGGIEYEGRHYISRKGERIVVMADARHQTI